MVQEIKSEEDINGLSRSWESQGTRGKIERIEDLPDLDQVKGASIEWVVEGIIAQGALHMVTSEPGAGKSTFLASACDAISRGVMFMGRATSKRSVLILDAENPLPAISERFERLGICTHPNFKVWGQWVGEDAPSAGGAIVLEWILRGDPKPLIVVDSVIAFHSGAENDSNETRKYMEQYRRLTAMGTTVVLLHHTGKSETSREYRGSSDYKASIDIGYKLTNVGDAARLSMLELRPFKQRFSVDPLIRILYKDGAFSIEQSEVRKSIPDLLSDLLAANRGITKLDFENLAAKHDISRKRARQFLQDGINVGNVAFEVGSNNRHLHFWKETGPG